LGFRLFLFLGGFFFLYFFFQVPDSFSQVFFFLFQPIKLLAQVLSSGLAPFPIVTGPGETAEKAAGLSVLPKGAGSRSAAARTKVDEALWLLDSAWPIMAPAGSEARAGAMSTMSSIKSSHLKPPDNF
jgi:hypothetical protein